MTQKIIRHADHVLAKQAIFDRTVAFVPDTLSPYQSTRLRSNLPRLAAVRS